MRWLLFWLWLATLIGVTSVSLETHEVFVLETARTMEASGDWLLPQFNGAPRLNKPPMNYWCTAALSRLDPFSADVQIWHGRFVSLAAGLLLVLATARIGTLLYNRETGFLAGLLLMCTQGFVHMTNSARPDPLYAALCLLQLLCWVEAYRKPDRTRQQWAFGVLGWFVAGLATLTKGPQVPVFFLIAWVVFLVRSRQGARIFRVLRPAEGLVLCCLMCLPWWIVLHQRTLAVSIDLSDSQLSGSLLMSLAGWKELLSLYYVRTLFALLVPVGVVALLMAPRIYKARAGLGDATRLLIYVCATTLIVYSLGGHYRKHYLLPILPLVVLLLTHALNTLTFPPLRSSVWKALVAAMAVCLLSGAGLLLYRHAYWVLWVAPVYALALVVLAKRTLRSLPWAHPSLCAQTAALAVPLVLVIGVYNAFYPMSPWRAEEQRFAQKVGSALDKRDNVAEWQADLDLLPFFVERRVTLCADLGAVKTWVAEKSAAGALYVVLPKSRLEEFAAVFQAQPLCNTQFTGRKKKDLVCVRIGQAAPRPASPQTR